MGRLGLDAAPAKRAPVTPGRGPRAGDRPCGRPSRCGEAAPARPARRVSPASRAAARAGRAGRLEIAGLVRREGDRWRKAPVPARAPTMSTPRCSGPERRVGCHGGDDLPRWARGRGRAGRGCSTTSRAICARSGAGPSTPSGPTSATSARSSTCRRGDEAGLADVTLADLRDWLGELAGHGAARSTLARRVGSPATFFRWAARTGRIPADPSLRLAAPRRTATLPPVLAQRDVVAAARGRRPRRRRRRPGARARPGRARAPLRDGHPGRRAGLARRGRSRPRPQRRPGPRQGGQGADRAVRSPGAGRRRRLAGQGSPAAGPPGQRPGPLPRPAGGAGRPPPGARPSSTR